MTTIAANTQTSSTTKATSAGTTSSSAAAKKTSVMGKDDFLNLLVAQLKNQDPLSPDDPTAFTAQLAQFSSLEQLTNLNTSMEGLTEAQNNSEKISSLSLIGKNVSYNSGTLNYAGQPIELGYQLDGTASSVTISIQDANGKTVHTTQAAATELGAGNHFITWDGTDQDGNPVASGKYTIVLQASAAGTGATVAASPLVRSVVTGVDLSSGMITTNAGEVLLKNIIGVTESKSTTAASTLTSTSSDTAAAEIIAAAAAGNSTSMNSGQTAQNIIDQYLQQIRP
jgi:flagellar basal-body rod modification protein FlgD